MDKRGFTLIELLLVIAIIGILSMVVTVAMVNARLKGRDAKRISDLKQIQTALELYFTEQNSYPISTNATLGSGNYACLDKSGWHSAGCNNSLYMAQVPSDPLSGVYVYTGSSSTYTITATIEGSINDLHAGQIHLTPGGIGQ